jgi:hypothetical protein
MKNLCRTSLGDVACILRVPNRTEVPELWSNHGSRIGANRYLIRFWEPPASRIFNQLPVNRVLSRRCHSGGSVGPNCRSLRDKGGVGPVHVQLRRACCLRLVTKSCVRFVERLCISRIAGQSKTATRPFPREGKLLGCFCEVRFPVFSCWPSTWTVLSTMLRCSEIYRRFTAVLPGRMAIVDVGCQHCAICESCKSLVHQGLQQCC